MSQIPCSSQTWLPLYRGWLCISRLVLKTRFDRYITQRLAWSFFAQWSIIPFIYPADRGGWMVFFWLSKLTLFSQVFRPLRKCRWCWGPKIWKVGRGPPADSYKYYWFILQLESPCRIREGSRPRVRFSCQSRDPPSLNFAMSSLFQDAHMRILGPEKYSLRGPRPFV